ncbi:MAG: 3-dehydroquinate synthase [Wolinella sp.]
MNILNIELGERSYPIFFGEMSEIVHDGKVLIVTNPKVGGIYLKYILERTKANEIYVCTIPDGEEYKNWQSIDLILESAFNHRLDRKSLMVALGGGVIGDMVGFASGIFQRGIDFIQIPTTLLAQVDSSVGGKTGINNAFGKNLIGLFHQPKCVHIDSRFLSSLPKRELSAGIAEMIKIAITFDKSFFEDLEHGDFENPDFLLAAIYRCVEIKAEVVALDETEQGIRAALNYGHTFGHAIEHESGYGRYLHGEAVGMGMVMANTLACKIGVMSETESERIKRLLERCNIPTQYYIRDAEQFYELFFLDKKSENSKIKFILPRGLGDVGFFSDIEKSKVIAVLETFCK